MSDPKRANLITVGAPKSAKKIVNKSVRLTINLVESNESKYPELNYKELVIAEERKKRVENGKTGGLDPFSDNDDDVEQVARKFEQKYGNNSTYGKKKRRSKHDDFADIGAGYDENDSFIDNTHGYDEMIPPDIDTFLGGFYINCGSLEFKTVPHDQSGATDELRRNKRRISSSSSCESSSSSSCSEDTKEPTPLANGALHSHTTEHRKKKNKKIDKQKAKKVRRGDSSAANSAKQTSDDNVHADGEGESVDSRTSHSDSLTSKPAPSSENSITPDSSRDMESKMDTQLPQLVAQMLEAMEVSVAKHLREHPDTPPTTLLSSNDAHIQRLEQALKRSGAETQVCRASAHRAARALRLPRAALLARLTPPATQTATENAQATTTATTTTATTTTTTGTSNRNKRKLVEEDDLDISVLSDDQREAMIIETIKRLMDLIEEFKPSMFANYNMECERVREEKKKLSSNGATVDKRLPKRRFPWCHRSRALLARISKLAGSQQAAAMLLADRVLPLFPKGFVRMPTLMRQANISKDIKVPEIKRQRLGSSSHLPLSIHPPPNPPPVQTPPHLPEQIQFPSSLTITATVKTSPDKNEAPKDGLGHIMNSFSLSKELIADREKSVVKEELYIPPNNIGSITITPVPSVAQKEKKPTDSSNRNKTDCRQSVQKTVPDKQMNVHKTDKQPSLIRVKSPAALNESVKKDVKTKKPDKTYPEKNQPNPKDKRVDIPLQIDTNFQPTKKEPSPKNKDNSPKSKEALSQKQIENLRIKENNIPRPALVPVHHSPTFAKPDKRPEVKKKEVEVNKKKEIMIVSDMDPLSDQEPVAVDDSSSDVEVIEDRSESEVPSKDNRVPKKEEANEDIDIVMRNIREMEHSQEPTKFNSNSYGGVVANSNAQNELL